MSSAVSIQFHARYLIPALVPEVRRSPRSSINAAYAGVNRRSTTTSNSVSGWLVRIVWSRCCLARRHAVTSYIVSRRTREIGVRVALGASGRQIITSILRRPLLQVGLGILIGTIVTSLMSGAVSIDEVRSQPTVGILMKLGAVALYGAFMLAVCLLACIVPTRRALSVQPTDALRTD
jgi:predicted lysophospholipase L1 biosynthesis ABC-type transport system permease subunit